MSAIEDVIERASYLTVDNGAPGEPEFNEEDIAAARSELERLKDCELIARASFRRRELPLLGASEPSGFWLETTGEIVDLPDDGTGLPALTPAARSALRAGMREEI